MAAAVTRVRTDQDTGDSRSPSIRTRRPSPSGSRAAAGAAPRRRAGGRAQDGSYRAVALQNIATYRTGARAGGASHPWGAAHTGTASLTVHASDARGATST
ncbi:hypothetical protein GCM10023088_26140 [Actinomadura verrucosospora]